MERISLVCYFREKMLDLGSWEYEYLRRSFVDDRRSNKDHKLYRPLWNGVSANMWEQTEWYDYVKKNGNEDMLRKHHPHALKESSSLEEFFG